jgi:hypothetical protein
MVGKRETHVPPYKHLRLKDGQMYQYLRPGFTTYKNGITSDRHNRRQQLTKSNRSGLN